ncbi:MAG: rRNA methyltransferase [Acidimicrobiaceae bacterium]|nr:rRNA methyltransferase [Acidimicrobiaceae bacterium]
MLEGESGMLVPVDDPQDVRLVEYRDLNDASIRQRREAEDAIFVVEGRIAVRQLLCSSYQVLSLLVDDHQAAAVPDLVDAVRARGAPVYVGPREVVAATVGFPLHRGVVAVARRPPLADSGRLIAAVLETGPKGRPPLFAVIEGVNDHENLGALFRNAAGFGVAGVLLDPTCADPLYRRSVRVSVGHVLSVPYARLAPWPAELAELRAAGVMVVALSPSGESRPERTIETLSERLAGATGVAVLVGAEGAGLSDGALVAADEVVSIRMASGVDSLNVATAAAIAFYELAGWSDGR